MRKNTIGFAIPAVMAIVLLAGPAGVRAADSDLSSVVDGPPSAVEGEVATITLGYHNAGPDPATSAYANAYIPSGVPAPIDELTQQQWDDLQASAVPDGLGNAAFLFVDEFMCEHLIFQVQEDDGDPLTGPPMIGLGAGVGDAVTFDLEIPMTQPEIGGLIIDSPASVAGEYKAATAPDMLLNGADWNRYGRGLECDLVVQDCSDLTECFGGRVSFTDPIMAEIELVNDGSADPTFGCVPLIGFTPGNIALVERGGCEFGTKGVHAQNAGATAMVISNDGRCGTGNPDSDVCVINMGGGVDGWQVNFPLVLISRVQGLAVIAEIGGGETIMGQIGAVSRGLTLDSEVFLTDGLDNDPDPSNDLSSYDMLVGEDIFADGFESGDTTAWSNTAP